MLKKYSVINYWKIPWHWWVFIALVGINFWQMLHHEMWRDEIQAWLIATESKGSLSKLFSNMRFEPQLGLWHFLLWLLSLVSQNPILMQMFHFLCGTFAAALVMVYSPFHAAIRLLVVTGYYISFEYLLISRNYVLGVLLVFLFCSLYETLKRKPVIGGIILGLLANTSIYGAILSLALCSGLMLDIFSGQDLTPGDRTRIRKYVIFFLGSYSILFLISIGMIAFSRGNYTQDFDLHFQLHKLLIVVLSQILSMAPVPDFTINFWNTHFLVELHNIPIIFLSSLAISVCIGFVLSRSRIGLFIFLFTFGAIALIQYATFLIYLRYSGHLFICFLACAWLGSGPWKSRYYPDFFTRLSKTLFVVVLSLNVIAAVVAHVYHARNPFSGGSRMADLIRKNNPESRPIIGHVDYAITTVSGYLGEKIYHASTGKPESFVRWNDERKGDVSDKKVLDFASIVSTKTGKLPLVLLNYMSPQHNMRLIGKTDGAIVADENFYLYEYKE